MAHNHYLHLFVCRWHKNREYFCSIYIYSVNIWMPNKIRYMIFFFVLFYFFSSIETSVNMNWKSSFQWNNIRWFSSCLRYSFSICLWLLYLSTRQEINTVFRFRRIEEKQRWNNIKRIQGFWSYVNLHMRCFVLGLRPRICCMRV